VTVEDSPLQLDIPEKVIFKIDLREVHNLKNMMNLMMVELERLFNEAPSPENQPRKERMLLQLQRLQRRKSIYSMTMTMTQLLLQMERERELI
jgi:hypothetical protein